MMDVRVVPRSESGPESVALPAPTRPVVVITGASSGIGRATAVRFAQDGADLVLAARGEAALAYVARECERHGASAIAVPTDVTDAQAQRRLAERAIERFGRIDVWINNVGVGAVGAFDQTPVEAHRRVIESNLIGHINGAHAVLPYFREAGRGTLINMASVGGWVPAPYAAAYIASKFGVRGFSESLRAELSALPDVHVCEVYPTFVDTPGAQHGANYTGHRLRPAPPLLDTRRVAETLVALARRPRPTVSIGSVAWPGRLAHAVAPNLVGRVTRWAADRAFEHADDAPVTDGNLFAPSQGHAVAGGYRAQQAKVTVPLTAAIVGVAGLACWWAWRGLARR